jgi:hypothetical protein
VVSAMISSARLRTGEEGISSRLLVCEVTAILPPGVNCDRRSTPSAVPSAARLADGGDLPSDLALTGEIWRQRDRV